MRYARHLIAVFVVLTVTFLGLHGARLLAQLADITDLQAGLIVGVAITWAAFQITSLVYDHPQPATQQD